jgi:hypothetical protein
MDNVNRGGSGAPESHRHQNEKDDRKETPGDTDAADIVGRTGEEMPEVAHDSGDGEHPTDNLTD